MGRKAPKKDIPISPENENNVQETYHNFSSKMKAIRFARFSVKSIEDPKLLQVRMRGYKVEKFTSKCKNADHTIRSHTLKTCFKLIKKIDITISLENIRAWLFKAFHRTRSISLSIDTPETDIFWYQIYQPHPPKVPPKEALNKLRLLLDHYLPSRLTFFSIFSREFEYIDKVLRRRHIKMLMIEPWVQSKFKDRPVNYFPFVNSIFLDTNHYIPFRQLSKTALHTLHLDYYIRHNSLNYYTTDGQQSLAEISRLQNLRSISIHRTQYNAADTFSKRFEPLFHLKNLKELKFYVYSIIDSNDFLKAITENFNLETLVIGSRGMWGTDWHNCLRLIKCLKKFHKKLNAIKSISICANFDKVEFDKMDYQAMGEGLGPLLNLTSLRLFLPLNSHKYSDLFLEKWTEWKQLKTLELKLNFNSSSDPQCKAFLQLIKNNNFQTLNLTLNCVEQNSSKDFIEYNFFEQLFTHILEKKDLIDLSLHLGKLKNRKKSTSLLKYWTELPRNLLLLRSLKLTLESQDYFFRDELVPLFEGLIDLKHLRVLTLKFQLMYPSPTEIEKALDLCLNYKLLRLEKFELALNNQKFTRKLKDITQKREEYHAHNLINPGVDKNDWHWWDIYKV